MKEKVKQNTYVVFSKRRRDYNVINKKRMEVSWKLRNIQQCGCIKEKINRNKPLFNVISTIGVLIIETWY